MFFILFGTHTWSRKEKREKCFAFIRDVVFVSILFGLLFEEFKKRVSTQGQGKRALVHVF